MITRRPVGYTLIGHEPLAMYDVIQWAEAFGRLAHRHRVVGFAVVGGVEVSTVFLGLDHNFGWLLTGEADHRPLLFETMTFPASEVWDRYASWDEAVAGHARCVAAVRGVIVAATN